MECAAEIVDFSKTYHDRFLLKPLNVEDSCDLVYKQIFRSIIAFFNGSSKTSQIREIWWIYLMKKPFIKSSRFRQCHGNKV